MLMLMLPDAMNSPVMNSSESPGRKKPMSSPHSAKMMATTIQNPTLPQLSRVPWMSGPRAGTAVINWCIH